MDIKTNLRSYLLTGVVVGSMAVPAVGLTVVPENGIYHDPAFQGRGYFIEYQKGIVSVIVYTHDEVTGRPDWFLAAGPLRDDADEIPGSDPLPFGGYYPLHYMSAPLFRYSGGPCVICFPQRDAQGNIQPLSAERIGTLSVYFDFLQHPTILVDTLPGIVQADLTISGASVARTNFGHAVIGPAGEPGNQIVDQRGRWIYSWKSRAQETLDVEWGSPSVTDFGSQAGLPPMRSYRLEYHEASSSWTMTCHFNYHLLPVALRPAIVPRSGCEVANNGTIVFSALANDIGLNEVAAFNGALPPMDSETLRGPLDIRGRRID